MLNLFADEIIINAIKEDITNADLSTESIYIDDRDAEVELIAKEDGIIAGLDVYKRVFEIIADSYKSHVTFQEFAKDGDEVKNKDVLMKIKSTVKVLLSSERVALNLLQRMSGVATYANKLVKALDDENIKIVDTRKTTPGLRILEKYAVRVGGANNHRYNLSDCIMLKDNHVAASGGVKEAIERARAYAPFTVKIEVETENLEMVRAAVEAGADIIMLDNMDIEMTKEAIEIIDGRATIEASGNITLENIKRYRDIAVDVISSGAITHSAGILDLSMKNLKIN
ncbi:carboxylating nicotinate-nucleotide diphosphorylase [Peptoniphilus sp. MSJ-1]|uniref:Quinolinate phosphoribosyltransferase [decarboxylating] n=1 Tax=Peptoniphilus ovalis TaxID=2841503 RepID=A0ABS6FET2_9FIRM|nr:carboxylating nicotinate-nucleotide diphosphorylase [Peptoniphilus ovalis]MBU5668699.1 carboxylating nicotinate-nucleotide diphosphorylase [Peptoniphilus ovalis]